MANNRGRPPKPEAEKRQQIGVRVSFDLKDRIERAAGENGRSVAQESEFRLTESFDMEELIGSGPTKVLLIQLAAQIKLAERATGKTWNGDPATYWTARYLIEPAIENARPMPDSFGVLSDGFLRHAEVSERINEVVELLRRWRVVGYPNALMDTDHPHYDPHPILAELTWCNPDTPEEALNDEDTALIRERIQELKELEEEKVSTFKVLVPVVEASRFAKAHGRVMADLILGKSAAAIEEVG